MKKIYIIIVALFFVNLTNSQDLNIKFLEQIAGVSFWSIDDVMENGYGFKKMKEENKGKEKTYVKGDPNNFSTVIMIKILNTKTTLNTLDVMVGKGYNIEKLKSNLVDNGYLYKGSNEYNYLIYNKDKLNILLAKSQTSSGFYQILMVSD